MLYPCFRLELSLGPFLHTVQLTTSVGELHYGPSLLSLSLVSVSRLPRLEVIWDPCTLVDLYPDLVLEDVL